MAKTLLCVTLLAALNCAACANLTTIHLDHQAGSRDQPVNMFLGDAKQAETVVSVNPQRGQLGHANDFVVCPGKNPDVYSVHSSSGSSSLGVDKDGSVNLALSGSATEIGAVIAPLAAVQMNRDNQTTICFDRLNGWLPDGEYDTVQMREHNMALAAFAFQAIHSSDASGGGAPIGGDPTQAIKILDAAHTSLADAKTKNEAAQAAYQAIAKPDSSGGSTCDGVATADADKCKTAKANADKAAATLKDAQGHYDSLAKLAGSQTPAVPPKVPGAGAPAGAGANSGDASASADVTANAAIVRIYQSAISRDNEITALCIKALESLPPPGAPLDEVRSDLNHRCIDLISLQAVNNAPNDPASQAIKRGIASDIVALSPSIYLQVPNEESRAPASQIVARLRSQGFPIARGVEARPDSPDQSQVRFYYDEDRAQAAKIAQAAATLTGLQFQLAKFPATNHPRHGLIEIWIGKADSLH